MGNITEDNMEAEAIDKFTEALAENLLTRCNHDAKIILDFTEDNVVMEVWGDVNPYELALKGTEAAAVIIGRIADGLIESEENKKDFQKLLLERVVELLEEKEGEK